MILINGVPYYGNNVTIINNGNAGSSISIDGKVVHASMPIQTRKIDEKIAFEAALVNNLFIDSSWADINVIPSNTPNVEIHLHGDVQTDGNINFNVIPVQNGLNIFVSSTGGTYFNGNLLLEIALPKKLYNQLRIQTITTNVLVSNNIWTNILNVKTVSGKVETNSIFGQAFISTTSGNVVLKTNAQNNIAVDINTASGDIYTTFGNIGKLNLRTGTVSGGIRNTRPYSYSGYMASGNLSSVSGNIIVC